MYRPDHFRVDDLAAMHALMRARPLATLVSSGATGLYATHMPTVLKDEGPSGTVEFHLARANPHWKELAECGEALMIFQGPEAYITPNWYPSKTEHQKVVPTWNYAVVHAYGRIVVHDDARWVRGQAGMLTKQQEAAQPAPWKMADAPPAYTAANLGQIVGIEIPIARLVGKVKAGQNRRDADREGAVAGLRETGDPGDAAMADLMEAVHRG